MNFLRALETLSGAVRAQTNGDMNDYYPKTILAKKIEVGKTRALLGVGHLGIRVTVLDLRAGISF
jgi:hypothetical protein